MIDVTVDRGRLIIREGGRLILDKGGHFLDAHTDGQRIVTLEADGRVRQLRTDGRFERDLASDAASVKLVGDIVRVQKRGGRTEEYRGGRCVRSY